MHAIVVGGSLVGLMHGIMLKHHGYDVDILEQCKERLEGQAAGVSTGANVKQFLDKHDRVKGSFSLPSNGLREFDREGKLISQHRFFMAQSSWDALYYRLRANFDGHSSVYCPDPAPQEKGDGRVSYQNGQKVVSIKVASKRSDNKVNVCYEDTTTDRQHTVTVDLVIAADGANSSVRSLFAPEAAGRRYCNYVMWRGLVAETSLSSRMKDGFTDWFAICRQSSAMGYAILYMVPGTTGGVAEGERLMNFAWYSRLSPEELSEALTDIDGHKHQWSVPIGKLKPGVWQKALEKEGDLLNSFAREVSEKVEQPFLQVCGDFTSPKAQFLDGKVLLVGDGLVTLRPHTGFGISSGAFHALMLEKTLFERDYSKTSYEEEIRVWERSVLEYSHLERLRSISMGEYYLGGWTGWIPAAIHYHGLIKAKAWWAWAVSWFR